jgi:hypothetical protein
VGQDRYDGVREATRYTHYIISDNDVLLFLIYPIYFRYFRSITQVAAVFIATLATASAFAPATFGVRTTMSVNSEEPKKGSGGMFDTRDPDAQDNEDPRKSISAAPSFEEYLKQREAAGN